MVSGCSRLYLYFNTPGAYLKYRQPVPWLGVTPYFRRFPVLLYRSNIKKMLRKGLCLVHIDLISSGACDIPPNGVDCIIITEAGNESTDSL